MKKKILCLAMALMMVVSFMTPVFAKDFTGKDGWLVEFNGKEITSNFKRENMNDELKNVQPGDSITLKVKLQNKDAKDTNWYMTNEIIKTLEEDSKAQNGIYTYQLVYQTNQNEKVIYDSQTVGGEKSKGLKEVKGLEDYFYLGKLKENESSFVILTLSVDGETQGNSYQATMAQLEMNFAVEEASTPTKTNHKTIFTTVKTGDQTKTLLFCALEFISGILIILFVFSRKKKGE